MPIKPENKARYPENWESEIRPRILARAGNRCEKCGVPHRAIGWRDPGGEFHTVALDGNMQRLAEEQFTYGDVVRLILIVLTVAHVDDPDPANCDDGNLAAWCQRCHNRHDGPMRRANATMTRQKSKGCDDLFATKEKPSDEVRS